MSDASAAGDRPRFSIVSAVYNVARYLDDFIESVEAQTFPLNRVEVVVVNDGSTDDSLERVEAWQRRRPDLVKIVSKVNGGLSSARNAGLPEVTGEWVTFTDPDDILDKRFLSRVDTFLRKYPETVMVATRRMVFSDRTGQELKHPLDRHFVANQDRLRNLDYDTGHFHGHAASTFFRSKVIARDTLRFDERLRATFEDGHFCNVYLLRMPEPLVGFVTRAEYRYRRREDGTSQLDRSWADPGRFIDVLEHGYLHLLQEATSRRGRAPSWLQGMVIYELYWYFRTNEKISAPSAATGETADRFHDLLKQITEMLDENGINGYRATNFHPQWREILRHGYRDEPWHTTFAVVNRMDADQRLLRVTYRFVGDLPDEQFVVYGKVTKPVHQKIRDIQLFDRTVLQERIVWLPFGSLRVVVGGADLYLSLAEPDVPTFRLVGATIEKALTAPVEAATERAGNLSWAERAVGRLATTAPVRLFFRDAWVLIDRIFNADDSAEHLFTYLREHRSKVNAWFVLEAGTPDFRRLRKTYGRRVLKHGGLTWKLAMLNAQHLISSHIDDVIMRPKPIMRLGKPKWRLTFLQHGVMKDDLSTWLNGKNIDIFVTSTPAEYQSVAGDHTTYRYTSREAKLTGLPRFDRILAEGNKIGPDQRDLILIAPTWRNWLSGRAATGTNTARHAVDPEFNSSEFALEWTALINSPEIRELAERTGLKVAVLLHPNFQDTAKLDTLPHVEMLSFEGQNIQEQFARARVLITDYSSMFFNASYIDRPVVYFQFDRDRVLAGAHLGRHGYFDYERDGFGPVTLNLNDAVGAVVKAVENGPDPEPVYAQRIRTAFPERDGRCCERVADAIANSTKGRTHRSLARRIAGRGRREARDLAESLQSRVRRAVTDSRAA